MDDDEIHETEVLFILSFDFERKTIFKWIPNFWD